MSLRIQLSTLALGGTLLMGGLFGAASFAETTANAEAAIQQRQDNFGQIGESFKTIRDQVRADAPDMAAISNAAATINKLAQELQTWFPAGTGPETGVETEALPVIWQDTSGFASAADRLVDESGKFLALTKGGDARQVAGGIRGLGGACKNCHDQFRLDDD